MPKKIAVIGSGFSGLSAAAYTAKEAMKYMFLRKIPVPKVGQGSSKQRIDTPLIWDRIGTGCTNSASIGSITVMRD